MLMSCWFDDDYNDDDDDDDVVDFDSFTGRVQYNYLSVYVDVRKKKIYSNKDYDAHVFHIFLLLFACCHLRKKEIEAHKKNKCELCLYALYA